MIVCTFVSPLDRATLSREMSDLSEINLEEPNKKKKEKMEKDFVGDAEFVKRVFLTLSVLNTETFSFAWAE